MFIVGCGTEGAPISDAADSGDPPSELEDGGSIDAGASSPDTAGDPDGSLDAATDRRIDPIEVGRSWTYDVKVLGIYPACSNGVFTSTTLESSQLGGKTALHVQSLCKNAGVYKYAVDGDRVHSWFGNEWHLSLDAPVDESTTWTDGVREYSWVSRDTVQTAAGTFDECWEARVKASYDSYTVFCRGVGPVKWHYEDGFGNGYEALLLSKSF